MGASAFRERSGQLFDAVMGLPPAASLAGRLSLRVMV
jgi:hypothetical protein